jgi:hypothetical protein
MLAETYCKNVYVYAERFFILTFDFISFIYFAFIIISMFQLIQF